MKAPLFWSKPRSLFGALLSPFEIFYGFGLRARRVMAKPYRAKIPLICVGNIAAGGSGKTPVAIAIAAMMKADGKAPVFVTRGYGGREKGPLRVDLMKHNAAGVGDEALLLARIAPTWVGCNRADAVRAAESAGSHIILDDGLQNPNIVPDIALLVIDGATGFGNGRVIPAGPLREPLEAVMPRIRAAIIVGEDQQEVARFFDCPVLRARMEAVFPENFPRGDKFLAFAGIGRPRKFFDTCRAAGLKLVAARAFGDHHVFSAGELAALKQEAAKLGARLLTTEKDFVRLPDDFRREVLTLPAKLVFERPDEIGKLLIIRLNYLFICFIFGNLGL